MSTLFLKVTTGNWDEASKYISGILPFIIISIVISAFALVDLVIRNKAKIRGGNKWLWAAIIIIGSYVGVVIYLLAGRNAEGPRYE